MGKGNVWRRWPVFDSYEAASVIFISGFLAYGSLSALSEEPVLPWINAPGPKDDLDGKKFYV